MRNLTIILLLILFANCTKINDENLVAFNSASQFGVKRAPNVIFILADDIGYEIPNCDRGQSYSTPNINSLAQNGTLYTHCYAMPMCSPSRVELMTGKYNFRNYSVWGILDTSQRTIGNIMKQAGYATCVAGKWQLDGGAASAAKFGFDTHCLFLPFFMNDETSENRYRYKNPHIYENGAYLPDSVTNGKYADDIFTQFICDFIDSNVQRPFFVYYPVSLCHQPFSPPPTNPDYAKWDPLTNPSNKKYFPDMVEYMDEKVGQIINKVFKDGIASNTIIIFTGDNGSPHEITSLWNGDSITGGKGTTTIYGIHVPLIISQYGQSMRRGTTANTLIDFSDFLPTLADIAGTKVNSSYGTIDGISFYRSITGVADSIRSSVFFHWQDPHYFAYSRWSQTATYKLYDSTNQNRFFNFAIDPLEQHPIPSNQQTQQEKAISKQLKNVLNKEHL
jgi:arylsulfatase A